MSAYTKAHIKAQGIFLKALTSGEYTQLKDPTRYTDGDEEKCSFCLLAVARNELALTKGEAYDAYDDWNVRCWLGDGLVSILLSNGRSANYCNDRTDMTFKQIAKQLKAYWLRKRSGT